MIQAQRGIDSVLIASQKITDGATVTANLDCKDCDHVTVRVNFGAEETTDATTAAIVLSHSDTTDATNFSTITASRGEDLASAHELRYEVDMKTRKRYLRLSVTAGTGTGSDMQVGAIATKTRNGQDPASTTAMQASTNDAVVIVVPS
jgi:hypothetical protein